MHKKEVIIGIVFTFLSIGIVIYVLGIQNGWFAFLYQGYPAPQAIPSNWKTYSEPNGKYSFKYPPDWRLTTRKSDTPSELPSVDLLFTAKNQNYYMEFSNNFLSLPLVIIQTTRVYYWGKPFDRSKTYGDTCTNTLSCYLWIWPNPYWKAFPFEKVWIFLPPTDTEKYVTIFDEILSTFKFISS